MKISSALEKLQDGEEIVVRDKAFVPRNIDVFKLETGESIHWIQDGDNIYMAVDEVSEEVILFHEIDAVVDPSQDSIFYDGDDYELSFEGSATVLDEDGEESDHVDFKDFERGDGQILRVMEYEVTGDLTTFTGRKIAEEELRDA